MEKIQQYLASTKGQAFKLGLQLCAYGTLGLTFMISSASQAGTALLTKPPMFGFVFGISNRMLPFGLFSCMLILTWQKMLVIHREYTAQLNHVAIAGAVFSVLGLLIGVAGL